MMKFLLLLTISVGVSCLGLFMHNTFFSSQVFAGSHKVKKSTSGYLHDPYYYDYEELDLIKRNDKTITASNKLKSRSTFSKFEESSVNSKSPDSSVSRDKKYARSLSTNPFQEVVPFEIFMVLKNISAVDTFELFIKPVVENFLRESLPSVLPSYVKNSISVRLEDVDRPISDRKTLGDGTAGSTSETTTDEGNALLLQAKLNVSYVIETGSDLSLLILKKLTLATFFQHNLMFMNKFREVMLEDESCYVQTSDSPF